MITNLPTTSPSPAETEFANAVADHEKAAKLLPEREGRIARQSFMVGFSSGALAIAKLAAELPREQFINEVGVIAGILQSHQSQ